MHRARLAGAVAALSSLGRGLHSNLKGLALRLWRIQRLRWHGSTARSRGSAQLACALHIILVCAWGIRRGPCPLAGLWHNTRIRC